MTIPMTDEFDLPPYDIGSVWLHLLRLISNLAASGGIPPCWGDSEYMVLARATISSASFRQFILDTARQRHDFNFNGGGPDFRRNLSWIRPAQHAYGRRQRPQPKRTAYDGWVNYRTHCPPKLKIPVPTPRPPTPPPTSPPGEFFMKRTRGIRCLGSPRVWPFGACMLQFTQVWAI